MAFKIKDTLVVGTKTVLNTDGQAESLQAVGTTGAFFAYDTTSTKDAIVLLPIDAGTASRRLNITHATLGATRTVTFPDATGTVVLVDATQTLTNKTLTAPTLNSVATLSLRDTAVAFDLTLRSTSAGVLTGNRILTFDVSNADRTIDLAGNLTLAANFTTSTGAITLTGQAGGSSVTVPSTGTLATLAGTETLTNKTINLADNTITGTLAQFNTALSGDDFVSLTGTETLTNKTLTTPKIADLIGSDADSGTITIRGTSSANKQTGAGGSVRFTDGVISNSTSTGTVVVTGGVGISGALNVGGAVIIGGNLTVNGTTTTVNSTTLNVSDKNIILNDTADDSPVVTPTDATANGGGITLKGDSDKTITYSDSNNVWETNIGLRVGTGLTLGTDSTAFTAEGATTLNGSMTFGSDTTDSITVNGVLANNTAWRTTSTSGNAFSLAAYDNNGTATPVVAAGYRNLLTVTAGNTPQLDIGNETDVVTNANFSINAYLTTLKVRDAFTVSNTTNATAKNTGALQVDGGVSVDKDIFIAGSTVYAGDVSPSDTGVGTAVADVKGFQKEITVNTVFVLDNWPIATYRSAEYKIQMRQGTEYQFSTVTMIHNGTTTYFTEYGVVESESGGVLEANTNFSTIINGTDAELRVTITDAATTAVKVNILRTLMRRYD